MYVYRIYTLRTFDISILYIPYDISLFNYFLGKLFLFAHQWVCLCLTLLNR